MLRPWVRMQAAQEHKQHLAHVKALFAKMKLHGRQHPQRITTPAGPSKED